MAEELHKTIIKEFKKRKVDSSFIDNISSADLAYMQLTSKFGKGFWISLRVTNIYSRYAWAVPLKDKKLLELIILFKIF